MGLAEFLPIAKRMTVAVAKAEQKEALETVHEAGSSGLADFVLIGDLEIIKRRADKYDLDISKADIVDESDEHAACNIAADAAQKGHVQVVMKGNVQTSVFTRALLNKERGLIPEGGTLSHVSVFQLEGYPKPLFLTDCAINIRPDVDKKAAIIQNAVSVARKLGVERPKIACIAPVERVSEKIESTVHARKLVMMQHHDHLFGDVVLEGPLAFDGAVSREAASMKGIEGEVPGDADILLFPCLDSANAVYKALTQFSACEHAGIIAGLTVPAVLTSRSDSAQVRLLSLQFALSVS